MQALARPKVQVYQYSFAGSITKWWGQTGRSPGPPPFQRTGQTFFSHATQDNISPAFSSTSQPCPQNPPNSPATLRSKRRRSLTRAPCPASHAAPAGKVAFMLRAPSANWLRSASPAWDQIGFVLQPHPRPPFWLRSATTPAPTRVPRPPALPANRADLPHTTQCKIYPASSITYPPATLKSKGRRVQRRKRGVPAWNNAPEMASFRHPIQGPKWLRFATSFAYAGAERLWRGRRADTTHEFSRTMDVWRPGRHPRRHRRTGTITPP